MPVTRYVITKDTNIYQINNITAIDLVSDDVTNGVYRDEPPIVVGGAGAIGLPTTIADNTSPMVVAGGVSQTVTKSTNMIDITGDSSVLQSDSYTHEPPRDLITPTAFWKFTTSDGIATYDCMFLFSETVGIFNAPPPGWIVTESQ